MTTAARRPGILPRIRNRLFGDPDPVEMQLREIARRGGHIARLANAAAQEWTALEHGFHRVVAYSKSADEEMYMSRQRANVKASRQRGDKEKLELFLALATELVTTDLAKKGFGYTHTLKGSRSEGLRQELEQPDENDLRSFLITFRKFISDNSDVYLQGIHDICYRRLTREDYRDDLVHNQDR
jgi:hypothetical protein